MMKNPFAILCCLSLMLTGQAAAWADVVARVLTVHDGDRLTIHHQGRKDMVYLHNVDCPELKQPYGKQAKHATAAYIANREVIVRDLKRDRAGRMTADILLPDGRQIAHELVKEGLAWVRPGESGDQSLKDMKNRPEPPARVCGPNRIPLPPGSGYPRNLLVTTRTYFKNSPVPLTYREVRSCSVA